jgi:predicted cobalt transporter CbtA
VRLTKLLRDGVTAGAAAGIAAALTLWLVVEPVIRRALQIEEARGSGTAGHASDPLVSRTAQITGGLATAVLVGVLVGVVFAVVFARTRHRLPGRTDVARAGTLAATAFLVLALLPAIKVPANPPAVGDPDTVTQRTLLYLLTILVGVLGTGLVWAVERRLATRGLGLPARAVVTTGVAVAWLVAVIALVPGPADQVPADVPPGLLWDFRVASLAQIGSMWLVLGLVFGALVESRAGSGRRVAVPT